jgi:CrcB protein
VNVAGSFIVGIIMALAIKDAAAPETRLLLATGFCGGFTTFSTFSYEFFALLQDNQIDLGLIYIALSVVCGLLAVWAGYFVMKLILP